MVEPTLPAPMMVILLLIKNSFPWIFLYTDFVISYFFNNRYEKKAKTPHFLYST